MTVSRRAFLAATSAAIAGLWIPIHSELRAETDLPSFAPNAYLHIAPDATVTIVVARSEMGQGVRTSLPMILAEELDCDFASIRIEQAGASTLFGDQTTGGSASVRTTWEPMRKAGAQARMMLVAAAAKLWSVEAGACATENGFVLHAPSSRRVSYGALAEAAAEMPVPQEPKLKSPSTYRLISKPHARIDTPSKVNGSAVFGMDVRVPGMKYACLLRAPKFGATVRRIVGGTSSAQVQKISDVAVAVVADSTWAALSARKTVQVEWTEGEHAALTSEEVERQLQAAASKNGVVIFSTGEQQSATHQVRAQFTTPFLAHAPLEPGNCTAYVRIGKCELWAPTQVPQDVRDSVATALNLKPEQVKVNVTLMGGGFGRRLEHDYAVEAALVSKAISAPVKVVWTREDDMQHSTYRPASLHQVGAQLDANGYPVSFVHRIISPSISRQKGTTLSDGIDPDLKDEGAFLYPVPSVTLEYVDLDCAVPLGWMRSVYASQVAFANECFLDELALRAGQDPLAYRLHLLREDRQIKFWDTSWSTARLRKVLQLAAEKASWNTPAEAGRYRGIAAHGCFGSYVAEVVEISMQENTPVVHRVICAIDCGQVVNPNILEQQLQSGVIFGLTQALHGKISVGGGAIQQSNFSDYALVRMGEDPVVESHFVPSAVPPTGAGEPPVPPLAPALCNAIFAATKKRIRAMPIAVA